MATKQIQRMSKKVSRSKNKKDQFDRLREHLLEGKPLRRMKDEQMLERCIQIFTLLSKGHTDHEIIKIIDKAGWVKKSMGYILIRKTKVLFGDAYISNKTAEKAIAIQMAKEAYNLALKTENAVAMVAATKLITQLEGTLSESQNLTIIYQNLTLPPIQISDDPKVIDIPPEDVSFEDE